MTDRKRIEEIDIDVILEDPALGYGVKSEIGILHAAYMDAISHIEVLEKVRGAAKADPIRWNGPGVFHDSGAR